MKLDLQAVGLYPREICTYCANEISSLMNALRGMYGLRRISLSVTVILLSASTVHLLNLPSPNAAMHLVQALQDLRTMSVNHQYASLCIEIIGRLADQWGIALPENAKNMTPFRSPDPPRFAAPNMSVFFTQAALSNDAIDALSGTSQRHDSGSMYEQSFIQHNYSVLPHQPNTLATSRPVMQHMGSAGHSLHSTPMQTTPVPGSQGIWSTFPQQQMDPTNLNSAEYQMMTDASTYGFNPYAPPG